MMLISDEAYKACSCTPTCSKVGELNYTCDNPPISDAAGKCCSCVDGTARHDVTGECIPIEKCPCIAEDGEYRVCVSGWSAANETLRCSIVTVKLSLFV